LLDLPGGTTGVRGMVKKLDLFMIMIDSVARKHGVGIKGTLTGSVFPLKMFN